MPADSDMQGGKLETKAGIWAGTFLSCCVTHPTAPETFSLLLLKNWRVWLAVHSFSNHLRLVRLAQDDQQGWSRLPQAPRTGSKGLPGAASSPSHSCWQRGESPIFRLAALMGVYFSGTVRPSAPWCRSAAGGCHCQPRFCPGPAGARLRERCSGTGDSRHRLCRAHRPRRKPRLSPGDAHICLLHFFSLVCLSFLLSPETPQSCTWSCNATRYCICGGERESICPAAQAQKLVESAACIRAGEAAAPGAEVDDRDAPSLSGTWSMFPEPGGCSPPAPQRLQESEKTVLTLEFIRVVWNKAYPPAARTQEGPRPISLRSPGWRCLRQDIQKAPSLQRSEPKGASLLLSLIHLYSPRR